MSGARWNCPVGMHASEVGFVAATFEMVVGPRREEKGPATKRSMFATPKRNGRACLMLTSAALITPRHPIGRRSGASRLPVCCFSDYRAQRDLQLGYRAFQRDRHARSLARGLR